MKIKELAEILDALPDDAEVLMEYPPAEERSICKAVDIAIAEIKESGKKYLVIRGIA